MDNPVSKVIGKGMILIGLGIGLYAMLAKDPLVGIIGGSAAMLGRVIDEYFYDWFDW